MYALYQIYVGGKEKRELHTDSDGKPVAPAAAAASGAVDSYLKPEGEEEKLKPAGGGGGKPTRRMPRQVESLNPAETKLQTAIARFRSAMPKGCGWKDQKDRVAERLNPRGTNLTAEVLLGYLDDRSYGWIVNCMDAVHRRKGMVDATLPDAGLLFPVEGSAWTDADRGYFVELVGFRVQMELGATKATQQAQQIARGLYVDLLAKRFS